MPDKITDNKPPSSTGSKPGAKPRIRVQNVNVPGYSTVVDAAMYDEMLRALKAVLPTRAPGLTQAEMLAAVLPHLSTDLFPGGAKAGWWAKTVQLDMEARGVVEREAVKPLRWHQKPAA